MQKQQQKKHHQSWELFAHCSLYFPESLFKCGNIEGVNLSQGHEGDAMTNSPKVMISSHKSTASSWTPPSPLFPLVLVQEPPILCDMHTKSPHTPSMLIKACIVLSEVSVGFIPNF